LAALIEAGEIVATAFNPWWFSGAEALTISFFQELRATVGKAVDEKTREAMASLGSRVSSAGPLLGGLAALFATPAAGAAVAGGATLIEKLTRLDSTVEKEHRKLVEALAKQNKKFLIVLDDIDRLTTDDALQLFKLIKSVGRLPNVIYLMAFDRHLAEKMVAERFPAEGSSYLEKVIQGAFDLPMPDPDDLCNQLLATTAEVMGAPPTEKMQRFWNLFHDGVAPLLKTPRDAVRLSNAIKVSWPAVRGEVDHADFLTMEAMRLFLPSTYEAVRAHPDMLTGSQTDRGHDRRALDAEYRTLFLDHLETPRERAIAERALRRLFPRLGAVWSNNWHSGSSQWQRDRLICAPEHFPTYFAFSVTNDGITAAESDALIAGAGTPGATAKALKEFLTMPRKKGGTRAALALDELSVRAGDIAPANLPQLVEDLFSVADELNVAADRQRGFAGIGSNDLRLHWLLNNLLRDRLELPERSQIIRAAAPAASLEWLVSLSDRCKSIKDKRGTAEESGGDNLADDETVDWLYAFSLDRIRMAAADGTLARNNALAALLYRWRVRAGDTEVRAWTDRQLADDWFVVSLAKNLVQESWSAGMGGFGFMGDRVARKTEYVHLAPLEPLLDVARLRERVADMLSSGKIDAADREVLERFRSAPERDPTRPYG
jgi:predicted KAP-like P-loop ATPase